MIMAATPKEEMIKQSPVMLPIQMSRRLREVDECPCREEEGEEEEEEEVKRGTKRPPSLQTTGLSALPASLDWTRQSLPSSPTASRIDACTSAGSIERRDKVGLFESRLTS